MKDNQKGGICMEEQVGDQYQSRQVKATLIFKLPKDKR
jgi:hypothetical protein